MKTKFVTNMAGDVTVSYYKNEYDGIIERTFTCPPEGGYVLENIKNDWKQVCDKLYRVGETLKCGSRKDLLKTIRNEYRAMRRAEKSKSKQK